MNHRYGRLLTLLVLAVSGVMLLAGARFWESSDGRLPAANPQVAAVTPTPIASAAANASATPGAVSTKADVMKPLQESLDKDPKNPATWREVGRLLAERKDYKGAAEAFAAAVELAPGDARARNDLGSALLYLGLVRVARSQFQQAVALDASIPDAHFNLALTLSHTVPSDTEGALREWRQVVQIAPDSEVARLAQGYIEEYSGAKKPGQASPHGAPAGATPSVKD